MTATPPSDRDSRIPVHAYAIASTLKPREVASYFDQTALQLKLTKTQLIVQYADGGWAVAYDFGALVFIDVAVEERNRVMAQLLARVGPEPHPPLADDFAIEIKPGPQPQVHFDRVIIPDLSQPLVEVLSLILAQSIAMEYYEEDVDQILGKLDRLSTRLAESGGFRGSPRELFQFIGQGMMTRNQVVHTLSLLDTPATVWESEILDRVYRALRTTFEIEDRYRALDHKLRVIQDNFELLVDLTRHRRTLVLEVTIVALIAIEVVLFVMQMIQKG